jgi:small-conductance mechanosensitive channel
MRSFKTRFLGVLVLAALLYMSGFGEWLKAALRDDWHKTLHDVIIWAAPMGKRLLMATLVIYVLWWRYDKVQAFCLSFARRHIHWQRAQQMVQGGFPVVYCLVGALGVMYAFDPTLSLLTAGTVLGTGVLFKPELDDAKSCAMIQSGVKVMLGEWVMLEDKPERTGKVIEINLMFTRFKKKNGDEIRVNNAELRDMAITVLAAEPADSPKT